MNRRKPIHIQLDSLQNDESKQALKNAYEIIFTRAEEELRKMHGQEGAQKRNT